MFGPDLQRSRALVELLTDPLALQIMVNSLVLATVAFLMGMVVGRPLINFLIAKRIGKRIRVEGPESHRVKMGTPTMGGLIIGISVFVVTAAFNLVGRWSMLLPLATVLSCGILGAADDLLNLARGNGTGLTARFKFIWLAIIALAAAAVLHFALGLTSIYVPLVGKIDIGRWYLLIAAITILGFANAVNLTDGLDTLAGGILALAFTAYGVIAFLQSQPYVVPLCFTVVGAILAFLWFNAHPAQVFMGDTGSLSLGALLAVVAFMTGQWLLLPLVGIVFVAEALSVMIQVAWFKISGGRRVFKMSPLHHHFELCGWSETQVTMRFWLIATLAAMLGVALALV